eukprot:TRINITY_DN2351_c0_g1_i2.p1 TRINITY_DN2351_c0_g1~~TRINITY_DN2351_c0_g1_i2.p1  ORF type:complete len:300 (+),score=1.75 TRINITY_DN2351_c0_g1_i2:98-997(+)
MALRGNDRPFPAPGARTGVRAGHQQMREFDSGKVLAMNFAKPVPADLLHALQQYGPAAGARKMMDWERAGAELAIASGVYIVWRCESAQGKCGSKDLFDCARIGPVSRCFCNHSFLDHPARSTNISLPGCSLCKCSHFEFVPSRPEEIGEWWLPRRKDFNLRTWRVKCKCGHGHDSHSPVDRHCRAGCACSYFTAAYACIACDKSGDEHCTLVETERDRLEAGRAISSDFMPLAEMPQLQKIVFGKEGDALLPPPSSGGTHRFPCGHCSRSFVSAVSRDAHTRVCVKMFGSARNVVTSQ